MRPLRSTSTGSLGTSLRAWGRARDGGVAVTVAVTSAVLVGVLALSIDLGRLYNASTERNNAADAAAIAAATQLDGSAGACARAIDAAIAADLANQETFTSNRTGPDVYISPVGSTTDGGNPTANSNVRFLSNLIKDNNGNVIGTYITDATTCDTDASFVEVTTDLVAAGQEAQLDYYFAGIIGALARSFPRGYAVAEYFIADCEVVPIMMCALKDGQGGPHWDHASEFWDSVENYELTGRGLLLKSGTNSTQWGPGNFGFLCLDGACGASWLGEQIGSVNAQEKCYGRNSIQTEPGNNSGARWAFNTRFDMYHGAMSGNIGDPNWMPAANSVKGLIRSGPGCGWGGGGYGDPPHPYTGPSMSPAAKAQIEAMPLPMDNCAYGGGPCAALSNLGRLGDGNWDRDTTFAVNHNSSRSADLTTYTPTDLLDGCVTGNGFVDIDYDGPGPYVPDCKMSRYEAYLWELGRSYESTDFGSIDPDPTDSMNRHMVDNTGPAGAYDGPGPWTPGQGGEHAGYSNDGSGPQCSMVDLAANQYMLKKDRRVIDVMVVNCDCNDSVEPGVCIKGRTDIPRSAILGKIRLLVLEPWQVNGGEHQISTEIIGPGDEVVEFDFAKDKLTKEWVSLKESRQARP